MTLIVLLVLVAGAMLAPGLVVGPSLDAAVFSHVGGRLLDGVVPYVGTWDHKPPGIYVALAAVQAGLGWLGPWTADWLLSLAASVGVGAAVAAVLARIGVAGWPRSLGALGATLLASQYLLALGGGLTEPLAAAPVAWAMVLGLRPASLPRAGTIGGLVGLSLLLSIQLLPAAAVVLSLCVVLVPARMRLSLAGGLFLGLAVALGAAVAWLAVIGAIPAAIDAIVNYSVAYRGSSGGYGPTLRAPVAAWTVLSSLFLIAPALLGAASVRGSSHLTRAIILASLLWIAGSLALFIGEGRFYAHYAIALAVPLGVLAGLGLEKTRGSLAAARSSAARALIALPLVATLVVSAFAGVISAEMELPTADQTRRMEAVAARVMELPGGSLLVWGNAPRLYDLAGRIPATRYSYLYPLTTPGYSTPAMVEAILHQLAANPPIVVVDAGSPSPGSPGFLPLLIDRVVLTEGRDLDLLDPLRRFVKDRYELVATISGWPVYLLRGAAGSPA